MKGIRSFARADDGAFAAAFVILLPIILFAAGLAIDLGHINAQKRHVQSLADLAALSSVRNLTSAELARGAAQSSVLAQSAYPVVPLTDEDILLGQREGRSGFAPVPDQEDVLGVDSVRVTVSAPARTFVLGMFMDDSAFMIQRSAIASAAEVPRVSFGLSNCLLNLFLLKPILAPLIPASVDVLCSGRGVDTAVEVFPTLTEIAARADVASPGDDPLTYRNILDADVPVEAVLETLTGERVGFSGQTIRLAEVLSIPSSLQRMTVGAPVSSLKVQASDLILATAEVLGTRIVDLAVGVDLGPLANVQAAVRVSEPRQIVIGATPGDPDAVARTSQIALEFDEINILNIFTLRLGVKAANASVALSDLGDTCNTDPRAVVAVFDPVDASLLDVDLGVRVLGLPERYAPIGVQEDTTQRRETRRVSFTREMYNTAPSVTIGPTGESVNDSMSSTLSRGTSELLGQAEHDLRHARRNLTCSGVLDCLIGGPISIIRNTLDSVVGTLVTTSANVLNTIGAEGTLTKEILSGLVGLDLAQAQLDLIELHCPDADTARLIR